MNGETFSFHPEHGALPVRLDHFLVHHMKTLSRTGCQRLIESACVTVNDMVVLKSNYSIQSHMVVKVSIPPLPKRDALSWDSAAAMSYNIDVVAEHPRFMIINKPAGLMVHSAPTAQHVPTLVDWIRIRLPHLECQGDGSRPGIVHRLDKDTSGLMIIPKDGQAHAEFSHMFQRKHIIKEYCALVAGTPPQSGIITYNIVRHPTHRTQMTHSLFSGRKAYTRYEVQRYFEQTALITCFPTTGRTHQIRVHCAAIGNPIIGDVVYGTNSHLISRQALHASRIAFTFEEEDFSFSCPLPLDMENALNKLG